MSAALDAGELGMFRDSVRRFVQQELAPHEARWSAQKYPDRAAWTQLGGMGLLLSDIPAEFGGGGGTFAHECIVLEELARVPVSSIAVSIQDIVGHYVLSYASESQRRRWLPQLARGETVAALGMSEPAAGTDLKSIRTRAARDGDHYVVNGSKTFTSNGHHADLLCLAVKTGAAPADISLLMIELQGLRGFKRGKILDKLGRRGQDTSELFFDNVRVPIENLLGGVEGRGFHQMMEQLPWERTIIAAEAVAVMERAVELTVEYAKQRQMFGQRLIDLQNTRFKLAECKTQAYMGRLMLEDSIRKVMSGTLDTVTAAMTKWATAQMEFEVTDECLQLHGGYGYISEYPISQLFIDGRLSRIVGGTNEIMKELIARSL